MKIDCKIEDMKSQKAYSYNDRISPTMDAPINVCRCIYHSPRSRMTSFERTWLSKNITISFPYYFLKTSLNYDLSKNCLYYSSWLFLTNISTVSELRSRYSKLDRYTKVHFFKNDIRKSFMSKIPLFLPGFL